MHWRRRVGFAVLGVGWAVALFTVVEQTPAADPQYVSPPAAHEAEFRKMGRWGGFPTRGVIGYRDEIHPDTPEAQSLRTQLYFVYQFILAPVLLDRHGSYEYTLVLSPTRTYLERAGGKP